jgi:hypothetical protein
MDRSEARRKYADHKRRAAERGIEFEFTFEEWCEIWAPHWERRGPHKDQLGMCRTRDQGAYAVGNIRLDTPKGNAGDRTLMRRRPWMASKPEGKKHSTIHNCGFKSYGSSFPHPDRALEIEQEEYEWIPGE